MVTRSQTSRGKTSPKRMLKWKSYTVASLGLTVVAIIGVLALRNFVGGNGNSSIRIRSLKSNMVAIQLGIEQFAGDNHGKYPKSLSDPDFKWSLYVPSSPRNPFSSGGETPASALMIDENIDTAGRAKTAVEVAEKDNRPFRGPGMIRYYMDRSTRATYALTASDKQGMPIKATGDPQGPIFTLHNHPPAGRPDGVH